MDWSDNLGAFDTFTRGENFGPFGLAWRGYLQQNTGASGIYTVTGTRGAASTMDVIVNADELYYVQDLVLGTKEQDGKYFNYLPDAYLWLACWNLE